MSEADGCIDRQRLVLLLGGSAGSPEAKAIESRLTEYERRELVKPARRKTPAAGYFVVHSIKTPKFFGDSSGSRSAGLCAHDAYHESLRSGEAPPSKPAPKVLTFELRYYSRADVRAIAPFEREIAPLLPEFCMFAWGSGVDPEAQTGKVVLPLLQEAASKENPIPSGILIRRLEKRGPLFNRKGRPVVIRKLIQDGGLIAAARCSLSVRGATGEWFESAVVAWLAREEYEWATEKADVSGPDPQAACTDLADVWKAPAGR
ncbi:MAG: hypothetical protein IV105_17625 [Rhizobacter sp.]|nr:hypothetical protein [Rhizobacter sp.]